jgi:uncharacterized protein YdaU (DUF1376 family)
LAEFPALPLWTDAYLGDTTHLTTIEHGAYLLLLMAAWRSKDTSLPDDDRLLARYARLTPSQWRRMRPVIGAFFVINKGAWKQSRLTDEAIAVRQKRDQRAAAGMASALKRKGRHATPVAPPLNDGPTTTTTTTPSSKSLSGDKDSSDSDAADLPVPSEPDPIRVAFDEWCALAKDLWPDTPALRLTDTRRKKFATRLKGNGRADWLETLGKVRASAYLRGEIKPWRPPLDWVLEPRNMTKILEGNFDDRSAALPPQASHAVRAGPVEAMRIALNNSGLR